MNLVDIDQEITFVYYDEDLQKWLHRTSTVQEFLSIYTAWEYLKVYHLDLISLGNVVANDVIRGNII